MAQITAHRPLARPEHDHAAERRRSVAPVALALALLVAVGTVGALLLRDLVDLAVWLMSSF
jgi:hypothetical protein